MKIWELEGNEHRRPKLWRDVIRKETKEKEKTNGEKAVQSYIPCSDGKSFVQM